MGNPQAQWVFRSLVFLFVRLDYRHPQLLIRKIENACNTKTNEDTHCGTLGGRRRPLLFHTHSYCVQQPAHAHARHASQLSTGRL